MIQRKASAEWRGNLKGGKGMVSTQSGALSRLTYSFATRFEDSPGTNPEELVAAAHAACFSMAYAAQLEGKGIVPQSVQTAATATMEKQDIGWTVTRMHLEVRVVAPNADHGSLQAAAEAAKAGCPISRLLKANITMDLRSG